MPNDTPTQEVKWEVVQRPGTVIARFSTQGVRPIEIPMAPQAAFEMGEKLARAAHHARYGAPLMSDESYLAQQIRARTTEHYRAFLVRRLEVMLNSLREDRSYTHRRLAETLCDTILTKVT